MNQPLSATPDVPRITMEDLAREAGVSKITVSRALSGHPLVKEETRARIRELAEKHGYRVNIAARNLRQQRTRTIGVVIEMTPSHDRSMSEPYPLSLLGGIMQELTSHSYNMVLTTMPLFVAAPPAVDGVGDIWGTRHQAGCHRRNKTCCRADYRGGSAGISYWSASAPVCRWNSQSPRGLEREHRRWP